MNEKENIVEDAEDIRFSKFTEMSNWECEIFGLENYRWSPLKNKHPNFFWRWMQYLCFGNRWRKRK